VIGASTTVGGAALLRWSASTSFKGPSSEADKEVKGLSEHALGTAVPVLAAADVARVIDRIAHQILEKTGGATDVALIGVPTRGVPLAARLAHRIGTFEQIDIPVGHLDTTLYRDDLRLRGIRPLAETVEPRGGISDRLVILVDDVLFSGRTIRAALDALRDLGRPRAVQLAVLVDRGHRELPIRADYVGKNLPTSFVQSVRVLLTETDGQDAVYIAEPPGLPRTTSALGGPA
jgi:pyrimidine operon attenuation protein / uracil phosphoribosyltransferase